MTAGALLVAAVLLALWLFFRWIPWSRKWFVLTDRRVIATWGVLNRNQAALLLDRMQDVSLSRPFPLSMIRDYGVIHLESAGEHAEERISGGLDELEQCPKLGHDSIRVAILLRVDAVDPHSRQARSAGALDAFVTEVPAS